MKKALYLFLCSFITLSIIAQNDSSSSKKEKFKPSKVLTSSTINVETFDAVECIENFDFYFEKGEKPHVNIETHENMHQMLDVKVQNGKLKFYFFEKSKLFKKLKFTIYYTDDLKVIESKGESQLFALERFKLSNLTINAFDKSKLFINGDFEVFNLAMDQKSRGELNVKSQSIKVSAMQNSFLIAMFSSPSAQFDVYQNAMVTIEGDSDNCRIRTTNSSNFTGKKFQILNGELSAELNSEISAFSNNLLKINASGESKFNIYGTPKVELLKFEDNSSIFKQSRN